MSILPVSDKILTFTFAIGLPVTLQYQPSVLSSNESSLVNSTNGVVDLITFIPANNNTNKTLNITSYFTSLDDDVSKGLLSFLPVSTGTQSGILAGVGAAASTAISVFGGGASILDATFSGLRALSLVKGVYDLTTGIINSNISINKSLSIDSNKMNKLRYINNAFKNSIPFKINWDIDQNTDPDQLYLIKDIILSAEQMSGTNDTTWLKADFSIIKQGVRIEPVMNKSGGAG